jgi:hypothetical protein
MVIRPTLTRFRPITAALLLSIIICCRPALSFPIGDEPASEAVPDWIQVIATHDDRLAHVESDQGAREVFLAAVGRTAGLHDVAATLAVQGISSKLGKELMMPQITRSAQRLVSALVVWRLAGRMMQTLEGKAARSDMTIAPSQLAWLTANGPFSALEDAITLWDSGDASAAAGVAAGHLAEQAGRQAIEEWWRLKTWKDRVRGARGQSRLCGTWQWVIHNHQRHHEEQKLSLVFPPPGKEGERLAGLSESVVLGDVVYLRWEGDGKVQEDSLLFSKEGQRLEGTFVNSQGGWGSISGKRTAACTP